MASKKVALVIVEGTSDKTALEMVLNRVFLESQLVVRCLYRDITSDYNVFPSNVVNHVTAEVKDYASKYGNLKPKDFLCVIQITDTDGAYIPPAAVVESATVSPDPRYTPAEIQTAQPQKIAERNGRKRENINKLLSKNTIWRSIPYRLYYMSCNMEDAFHQRNNVDDLQKKELAAQFQRRFKDDVPGFFDFLRSLLPPPPYQDYKSSWEYIKQDLHSLERFSNLYTLQETFFSVKARADSAPA